jgi:alkanesulfonate monooxygenase SsuD/methylene tetrahydromethanopterin reductase-like flavin-dependent oxidoreductase (luciferase family)
MHVGMAAVFQNPGKAQTDREVYRNELRLADLAEPLGFESIWGVEHHFTDYTMCPDVLQFLTYMAGRTERARLGSMVVVLPWHDPMRVAEEVAMLDNISGGRLILGLGRGAGKVEFDGFRLSMDESRGRFVESAEMLLGGLETGYCEYSGRFISQPRAAIRPAPFKSFRGRTYAAAVSPESLPVMAKLGVGILIIPQKPWKEVAKELDVYRTIYREVNGADAPPPVSAGWTFCDESAERALQMARRYIGGYYQTVLDHYQFQGDHLARTKGYEYYGKMAEKIAQYGTDTVIDYFMNLQVWGTPAQCYEKILDIHTRTGNSHYVGVFSYAGMPYADAERNMRLFAREVMPALQKLGADAPAPGRAAAAPRAGAPVDVGLLGS